MNYNKKFEQVAENVVLLCDKMFPLYLITGERNFLMDSGVTTRGEDFFQRITRTLTELTGDESAGIDTLLLTHSHWDHAGAAYYLQSKFDFDVLGSHRTVELLAKDKVIGFIDRLNRDYKKMCNDTSDRSFGRLTKMRGVGEGDKIPVSGDRYFDVFATPGHTKCSTSYLLQPEGVLFPGDASGVLEQTGGFKPLFLSSYTNYTDSIRKLIELNANILALPHNRYVKGAAKVKQHLEGALTKTEETRDLILGFLKEEPDVAKIAETIYRKEFPKPTLMGPREALMINLEAMVKSVAQECAGMTL